MKSKYEISIWSDVFDDELDRFVEEKEIIIGSDTMTSENRARDPKMVNNINGTNKFTFDLYYRYIDTRTGEEVQNPYVPYLVNERKIKVFWKDEWYDLLVKQIKEDQVNHVISYTCEDSYVTELSRTGFELEFATELENNIGAAEELINKVIENTDWQFDKDNSDIIYQTTEEAVYETTIINNFMAAKCPDGEDEIIASYPALVYYSCAPDINNVKDKCQFYYAGSMTWKQDVNEMLVLNGDCYEVDVTWRRDEDRLIAIVDDVDAFAINFEGGLSTKYRAERYVQSQNMVYNDILGRYVNVYNDGSLYGYMTTEYNDALAVVNLITNPSNFKNVSGWVGEELYFKISPTFNGSTDIATYTALSYLRLLENKFYFNMGIQHNRSYAKNGFIEGDKYIFRIKAKENSTEPYYASFIQTPSMFIPSIQSRNSNYMPTGEMYFQITDSFWDAENEWLEYDMTCIKSCSYDNMLSSSDPFGIFVIMHGQSACWIQEIQFYREVWGNSGYTDEIVRIDPGKMDVQSVAQPVWKYFNAEQPAGTTKNNLEYVYTSLTEWDEAIPVNNHYERYATIEESNSNRFNILQSIAEAFQCWVRFVIEHDERGAIAVDDEGRPLKYIRIKKEAGQETGIGFIYGIDLKGVTRTLKSNSISTKTIVSQNENEFGENGFCSIARSDLNYPKENVIYNFDYYIQHGLLDRERLYKDLYTEQGLNYYTQLHILNEEYAKNLEDLINKKSELTKQNASATIYGQYIVAAIEEKSSIEESLMKLAGVASFDEAKSYASTHYRDTKVQSLMNDRSTVMQTLDMYLQMNDELQVSLNKLKEYIDTTNTRQDEIIDALRELNRRFYTRYARFIQEGTWTSEDYWDDNLYYLDAVQVAYESSRPQVQYEINVLRLSELDDYSSKVFKLGDISFIQDVKYFGYLEDKVTPYKEKVVLTEITSCFDTPDKDTIKVQNYKTQFDDLFQRITAATQSLEFSEGKYARAASILEDDGTIKSSVIQSTFDSNKDLVYGAQNESVTMDNTGVTVTNNADASHLVKVTSGGVFVSQDGGETWKNAIRGDGINTDLLTAGRINTEQITVYNGEYPSFRWDPNGLNAYKFTSRGVDTTQFVRFDQYGVYGLKNAPQTYVPTSEAQIYQDANFGLTWNKFFMKSASGGRSIEISTDKDIVVTSNGNIERVVVGRVDGPTSDNYGIKVRNEQGQIVFQCDNEGSYLSGWTLTNKTLQSQLSSNNQNIVISAEGNIGCYGHDEYTQTEPVYTIMTQSQFYANGLGDVKGTNIPLNATIYPFVSAIGSNTARYEVDGSYASHNHKYDNPADTSSVIHSIAPNPPPSIQLVYNEKNYQLTNITWNVTIPTGGMTYEEYTSTYVIDDQPQTITRTTYSYRFTLTAKVNGATAFIIPYNITSTTSKNKYVPAADTSWYIDKEGNAIFHNIFADGGQIAGWWIDSTSIYQTKDGTKDRGANDSNVKTQLNSTGSAKKDGLDYSIITDAVNAAMATLGGVLLQDGLVNGVNIKNLASAVSQAQSTANSALGVANSAKSIANGKANKNHTHGLSGRSLKTVNSASVAAGFGVYSCPSTTDAGG